MEHKVFQKQIYSALSEVIKINHAEVGLERRLQLIVSLLTKIMEVPLSGYFSLEPGDKYLVLEAASDSGYVGGSHKLDLSEDGLFQLTHKKEPIAIAKYSLFNELDPIEPTNNAHSLLAVPVISDQTTHGAIVLFDGQRAFWSDEEKDLLMLIGQEIAGSIGNENILLSSQKRIAELTTLFELEKVLGTTLELQSLLETVARTITQVMGASGCAIWLNQVSDNRSSTNLGKYGDVPSHYYEQGVEPSSPQKIDFFCDMATSTTTNKELCPYLLVEEDIPKAIIAPLSIKGKILGKLCIHARKTTYQNQPSGFTPDDVKLVSTMGSMIAKSVENAFAHADIEALARDNEAMIRELSTLYKISGDLMTTVSEDEIGEIIISAVTGDQGLKFGSATIFLIDEHEQVLKERWRGKKGDLVSSEILKIQLDQKAGALAKAVKQMDILNISGIDSDPLIRNIWPEIQANKEQVGYSVVPLIAKGKVIGVMVVENSGNGSPAANRSTRALKMLANHAGLALETARLYSFLDRTNRELVEARELLTEAEKLAAMGEMASTLAHEIRNPLVSIGGLARRAIKVASGHSAEKRYLEVIVDEVVRLEKTLKELLDFVQEPEEAYAKRDLNVIIEECLELMQREFKEADIVVHKNLTTLLPVFCDARQIKHTLFNILLNARQAMSNGGTIWVSSLAQKEGEDHYATCAVRDTGGGIPESVLHNIFNPFFTTKKSGFGLGLAISYRIISRHQGKIDVENELGKGVTFIIKLPLDRLGKKHQHLSKKPFNTEVC